jgi:hypothetical protein
MRSSVSFIACLLVICAVPPAAPAANQDKTPVVVPRIAEPIAIDGRLDEAAWRTALKLNLPVETDPGENIPAIVATDVYIMYDGTNLYFGVVCHDPEPSAIRARYNDRDANHSDDLININLDTFNDERRNYYFGVSAVGNQRDGIETPMNVDQSWDAIWDSAGVITDEGYVVEMSIPFSCLQFQRIQGPQIWGLDISRWYPRDTRHRLGLVALDRNNNSYQAQFLKILGFDNIEPGRNLEIAPTVVASRTDTRPDISARWGVTNNIMINGTINPDFSQVEADARQLDINRPFALFFAEKRPFFMEGIDYFRTPFNAVYTRTIRDPLWGAKVTGKEGDNTIGVYVARDELTNIIFPGPLSSASTSLRLDADIGVFRYKRDFGTRTTVGALATVREGEDYHNRLGGIDGLFRLDDRNTVAFQVLGSTTQYPDAIAAAFGQPTGDFSDYAVQLEYEYRSRNLDYYIGFQDIGGEFRADLGYIPRVGIRGFVTEFNARTINNEGWWNVFQLEGEYAYMNDQDGNLLWRQARGELNFRGTLQSAAGITVERNTEAYGGREFEITSWQAFTQMQPTGELLFYGSASFGDRVDYANSRLGEAVSLDGGVSYSFGKNLRLDLSHSYEALDVPEGDVYTANISQGTAIYHINARTFLRLILQYVDYDYNQATSTYPVEPNFKQLFTQFLFSYKINPQTVLFLGYSDDYFGGAEYGLTQADRTFFMKIGYAFQM